MAKTLRTSGDYTIKAGAGSGGSNSVTIDSATLTVNGNLDIKGTQTVIDSSTLSIEDPIIILSRNNSGADIDSGIMINRGNANNAFLYWNEGVDKFKAVTSTSDGTVTSVTDTALANIQVAEPSDGSDAATKTYADAGGPNRFAGNDSTTITVDRTDTLRFTGTNGITAIASEPDTVTINLGNNLVNINSIDTGTSNGDLILRANGTGDVIVSDTLTWSAAASTPTATAVTKIYNKTAAGGGTGVFFVNANIKSGAEDELISKSKATALAIALG